MQLTPIPGDQSPRIQAAIDLLSASGGGQLVLAAGRHDCGALRLRSGVDLHLAKGAVLAFLPDYDAYAANEVAVMAEGSTRALVTARGQTGIAITGPGQILAPGPAYVTGFDAEVQTHIPARLRPRVLVLEDCRDVRLQGFNVNQSPMWTLHLVACQDVLVQDIRITNDPRLPNTDGIVIDACSQVLVQDIHIVTADDGICLKTSRGIGRCSNVTVQRAHVSSQSCALKIGTESHGDIHHVRFEDCTVTESNRALGIFSRDGGVISDICFARINVACHETPDGFWGSGEAITITLLDRVAGQPAGAVRDVVFQDISGRMQGAICLMSLAAPLEGITLRRIDLQQLPGTLGTGRSYDIRPTGADLVLAPAAKGRANAWTKDSQGRLLGVSPYPGGLPGLYAQGDVALTLDDITIERPSDLPAGWSDRVLALPSKDGAVLPD